MIRSSTTSSMSDVDQQFWDYFNYEVTPSEAMNVTGQNDVTLPAPEQGFVVGIYSALLTTGAFGNVTVFTSLVRSRRRKSRVNLLMTHLAVADMIVTFIVIPLEIGWRTTNAWLAGNLACKFFLVLRAFGLYLSSNVLVCISLDRFFAVLYPLRLPIARKRSKMMLSFAWFIALLCSLPQSLVFRVMSHPKVPEFQQCVSFEAFSNQYKELAYNVFCLCAMYFLPLLIITVCYACIFYEISKNSKDITVKCQQTDHSRIQLRRSDRRPLARARRRTLRMTVTIVTVFACCWLPYATMTLWYMLDRQSAIHVSARVQDLFFIMAVSNSCMNPLVYGSYTLDFRNFFRTLRKIFCIHSIRPTENTGISGPGTLKSKLPTNDVTHPENAAITTYKGANVNKKRRKPLAGWNKHVSEAHRNARLKFNYWLGCGKPCSGPIYTEMVEARKVFKGKIRWCQNHQEQIKIDLIAVHHSGSDFKGFWKCTNKLNSKPSVPISIDGTSGPEDIAKLFKEHFAVQSTLGPPCREFGAETRGAVVTTIILAKDIRSIINKMTRGTTKMYETLHGAFRRDLPREAECVFRPDSAMERTISGGPLYETIKEL